MIYCFDLDGTLCSAREDMQYHLAQPYWDRIAVVNRLSVAGHYIVIDTARGSGTGDDWFLVTKRQLDNWGLRYNELRVGQKPFADKYIDDRAELADFFFDRGDT